MLFRKPAARMIARQMLIHVNGVPAGAGVGAGVVGAARVVKRPKLPSAIAAVFPPPFNELQALFATTAQKTFEYAVGRP